MDKFDIIVLGGGPGGYVAAIRAAQLGAKVALIEKDKVGGTCLNRGCIPTKAIIACTSLYEQAQKLDNFGISAQNVTIDLQKVITRKDLVISKIVKGLETLIKGNKIEIIYGQGTALEPGKVEINKSDGCKLVVGCGKLILATGSSPASLPNNKIDGERFISSNEALNLTNLPAKIDIVGGGVIGIHFASIFSALGSEVTIYEALPEILTGIDEEVVALIKRVLKRKKVNIITNTLFDPAKSTNKTLLCVGRTPNLQGLETLSLKMDNKSVWVNDKMETSLPRVYAVGDLVSHKMLAHVAYEQGEIAAENALLGNNRVYDDSAVPIGLYTHPEIGSVGLTEKEAKEQGLDIKIGKFAFGALGIAQALGELEGFIKVVSNQSGIILGVHIIGPEANNLLGLATLAIKNKLSVSQLANTFQAHPSYPEGLQEASLSALNRSLHSLN